ncbi:MAG: sugar phosphate isomerase/epimerase [Novosphingobium sp.]|nr:sugar phosphate isomerase/epimerase [Novosphingobium sp.]
MQGNRRQFLAGMTALSSIACPGADALAKACKRRPDALAIGLQAFTLGEDQIRAMPETLRELRRIGYRKIELGDLYGYAPAQLRKWLDDADLICRSMTIPGQAIGGVSLEDDLDALAVGLRVIGVETVVMPIMRIPDRLGAPTIAPHDELVAQYVRANRAMTAADWSENARVINDIARRLQPHGLRMGYHNHNFEFAPLGGTCGMEILLAETDPAMVDFEMDAGWVAAAGHDPAVWLARYPGRFRLMHVKDILPTTVANFDMKQNPCPVGQGIVDWPRLLPAARAAGVAHFYVEQEPPFTMPRIEAIRSSYRYLSSLCL